jgi:hypothetical protein
MVAMDTVIVRRQFLGWADSGVGAGTGDWEIEGLVLRAVSPVRTPTIPVMISFARRSGLF